MFGIIQQEIETFPVQLFRHNAMKPFLVIVGTIAAVVAVSFAIIKALLYIKRLEQRNIQLGREVHFLEQEQNQHRAVADLAQAQRARLEQRVGELQDQVQAAEVARVQADQAQAELAAQIQRGNQAREAQEARALELERALEGAETHRGELLRQFDLCKQENSQLRDRAIKVEGERDHLAAEAGTFKTLLGESKTESASLRTDLETCKQQLEWARKDQEQTAIQLADVWALNAALGSELMRQEVVAFIDVD